MSTPTRPFGRKQPPGPIPHTKDFYEPLLKRELANRLLIICTNYVIFISLFLIFSTLDFQRGPPLGLLGHLIALIMMVPFMVVIGALPPLVLRARGVSAQVVPSPTRAAAFVDIASNPRTLHTLTCFAASGLGLTFLHCTFVTLTEWDESHLTILTPTRRNAFRLNERFVYLAAFNAGLGLIFSLRDLIRRRWAAKWPLNNDDYDGAIINRPFSIIEGFLAGLNQRALLSTVVITTLHLSFFPVSYRVCRALMLPLVRNLPLLSRFARPLLHGFGKTWVIDVSWSRMVALGFKTSIGWEIIESSFDYWSTKPVISSSLRSQDPNLALISGLHSQNRYFKHHAYLELSALAASSKAASATRRTALFTDSRTDPTLWSALLRELLITLGQDYQVLLRRGKPPPALPPVTKPTTTPTKAPRSPSTPLLKKQILKPSPRSLLDSLASDDTEPQKPTPVIGDATKAALPTVFFSTTSATPIKKAVDGEATAKPVTTPLLRQKIRAGMTSAVINTFVWIEGMLPSDWHVRGWWTDISLENVARACLPERELDIAGIEALSRLVAVSLAEDTLGAVQRDIPRVLEALLSFLGEAEVYKAELESKLSPEVGRNGGTNDVRELNAAKDVARAIDVVQPVIVALRTGVGSIAMTFGDRLGVYRFPPITTRRLQTFMDLL